MSSLAGGGCMRLRYVEPKIYNWLFDRLEDVIKFMFEYYTTQPKAVKVERQSSSLGSILWNGGDCYSHL